MAAAGNKTVPLLFDECRGVALLTAAMFQESPREQPGFARGGRSATSWRHLPEVDFLVDKGADRPPVLLDSTPIDVVRLVPNVQRG